MFDAISARSKNISTSAGKKPPASMLRKISSCCWRSGERTRNASRSFVRPVLLRQDTNLQNRGKIFMGALVAASAQQKGHRRSNCAGQNPSAYSLAIVYDLLAQGGLLRTGPYAALLSSPCLPPPRSESFISNHRSSVGKENQKTVDRLCLGYLAATTRYGAPSSTSRIMCSACVIR